MPLLAPVVGQYVASIIQACASPRSAVVSAVLFGSSATGGYSPGVSDVDLLIVLRDGATKEEKRRMRTTIAELEIQFGLMKPRHYRSGALERLAARVTLNDRTFFVCTRRDLLSASPAGIFDIPALQARFVDRIAIASVVGSGVTIWGEDLLPQVSLPPIRRLDVAKAFFSSFNQALLALEVYPLLPGATRYAMETLKRSIHNCYFCYHSRTAPLSEEVAFFQQRLGPDLALAQLMELRARYQPSFRFVLRCLPAATRLHLATARQNQFPRPARASDLLKLESTKR